MRSRLPRSPTTCCLGALVLLLVACRPSATPQVETRAGPRNVLLFTLDTTRADHLGCYGNQKAATRSIDALAARGVLFEHARTPVPLTLPAHTTIMTGLLPCQHGVRDNGLFHVPAQLPTLASVLKDQGFATGAFVGSFVLDRSFGLDHGFDVYSDVKQKSLTHLGFFDERPATAVTRDLVQWLSSQDGRRPFFAWVHYFDAHAPYRSPLSPPGMHPYDAEIAFVDEQVAVVLAALEQRRLIEDTLVIVTADHGESLGEHGEETHGHFVYEATMHVPLVFAHPSLGAGRRVASAVGLQDLAATVVDVLGVDLAQPLGGRSLKAALHGGEIASGDQYLECFAPYYAYGWSPLQGLVSGALKLVRAPRSELYDLRADPLEQHDLAPEQQAALARAGEGLDQLLARHRLRAEASAPDAMDSHTAERLAALGYVGRTARALPKDLSSLPDPKDQNAIVQQYDQAAQLMRDGKLEACRQIMARLVEREPENATFHSHYGMLLGQMGKLDEAIPELQRAIDLGQLHAGTWFSLGQIHQQQGHRDEAERCFRHSLAIDPKHLGAQLKLAESLDQAGQQEEALARYRTVLEQWDGDDATRSRIERRIAQIAKP
ncbi:MAG: sulfatase-like hydrolase/transferase [Planctomycetota bacterium]